MHVFEFQNFFFQQNTIVHLQKLTLMFIHASKLNSFAMQIVSATIMTNVLNYSVSSADHSFSPLFVLLPE